MRRRQRVIRAGGGSRSARTVAWVDVASGASHAIVAFDRSATTGALTPKQGAALCVSEDGSGGLCGDGVGLTFVQDLTLSPDGRNVYAVAITNNDVTALSRNIETGVLTSLGCFSETAAGGCSDGRGPQRARRRRHEPRRRERLRRLELERLDRDLRPQYDHRRAHPEGGDGGVHQRHGLGRRLRGRQALDTAASVAITGDGRHVYAVARGDDALLHFDRNQTTGALTQKAGLPGCITEAGGDGCTDGKALDPANAVAISPDDENVYVATGFSGNAIAIFDRADSSGNLTQKSGTAGCVSNTGSAGSCVDGVSLVGPGVLAVSPDGLSLYASVAGSDAVAVFDRDPINGTLEQKTGVAACLSETGTDGTCTDATALDNAFGVVVSPDGRSVYAVATVSGSVAAFTRQVAPYDIDGDGELTALRDGVLLLRFAFGFTGATLVSGVIDPGNCTRCTAPQVEAYLEALSATP